MSPLDRKLLRDLWRIKGQAAAIGLVMAVGVMLLVMMRGWSIRSRKRVEPITTDIASRTSLRPSPARPSGCSAGLAAIPGVGDRRGAGPGRRADRPAGSRPAAAGASDVAARLGAPRLNNIYLTDGRLLDTARRDEVLLLQGFAAANGLGPGDTLSAPR